MASDAEAHGQSGPAPRPVADTSVAVPALVVDHEDHARAAALLDAHPGTVLAGHAWFEAYSVLTRLPPPLRVSGPTAVELLRRAFAASVWLDEAEQGALAAAMPRVGVAGGAVYDALVAWVAVSRGAVLLSLDRRARPTYALLGAAVRTAP
jgi:predicted nucleic acid-binding protein